MYEIPVSIYQIKLNLMLKQTPKILFFKIQQKHKPLNKSTL